MIRYTEVRRLAYKSSSNFFLSAKRVVNPAHVHTSIKISSAFFFFYLETCHVPVHCGRHHYDHSKYIQ